MGNGPEQSLGSELGCCSKEIDRVIELISFFTSFFFRSSFLLFVETPNLNHLGPKRLSRTILSLFLSFLDVETLSWDPRSWTDVRLLIIAECACVCACFWTYPKKKKLARGSVLCVWDMTNTLHHNSFIRERHIIHRLLSHARVRERTA